MNLANYILVMWVNTPYSQYPPSFASMAQIDGIKAMLRDISGAKQMIKFAYTCTSNPGQDCSFSQHLLTIFVMLNVQFKGGF